ncbi:MAG TPA: hypothetical protein VGL82_17390 [Bryobacteraceae bacterium]|jgi:hypothetical protein
MAIQQADQQFSFRQGNHGRIIVSNSGSYTMAEYDEFTGLTRWTRVVSAPQREKVQKYLLEQYPIKQAPVVATNKSRRAIAA